MSQYQINPFRFLIRLPIHYSLIDFAQTLELGEFLFKYTDGPAAMGQLGQKTCLKKSFALSGLFGAIEKIAKFRPKIWVIKLSLALIELLGKKTCPKSLALSGNFGAKRFCPKCTTGVDHII